MNDKIMEKIEKLSEGKLHFPVSIFKYLTRIDHCFFFKFNIIFFHRWRTNEWHFYGTN